jgi:NitT/TauT family transport system substrate-binding protein
MRPVKILRPAVIGILAAAALAVAPASAAPFRLIVTDLTVPLVTNSVTELALNLGYFEREGVDVELVRVQQTPMAVTALQTGEGEMANIGVDAALELVARNGSDLKAVISPGKSLAFLIAAKDGVGAVKDLEGKSFGVGRVGSVDYGLSRAVLAGQGVDIDKMQFVALGQPSQRAQALAAGQIDSTTMSLGTWTTIPDKTGLKVLVDPDAYFAAAPVVSKVNVVSAATLADRGDEVKAVVRALIKASRDFAEDPGKWVDAMAAARPEVARADLESLAKAYAKSWSVNGGLSQKELEFTSDWYFKSDDFADVTPIAVADWVDFTAIDAALEELGAAPGMDEPTR